MSTKKTTMVMVNPQKSRKRRNKSRSNTQKGSQNSNLSKIGQQQSAPIAKTIIVQTTTKGMNHNYRFPPRREMVKTVYGSTGEFTLESKIILNPGDPSFSTWISNHARCFEFYKFHSLKFFYVPRCPTTTLGEVFLSPDMNARDPQPITEEQACQNEKTRSVASWGAVEVVISKKMMSNQKSWRCRKNGIIPDGGDIDLYDVGNLFILTGGQTSNGKIGQLWVEYQVEFFNPEGDALLPPSTLFSRNTQGLDAVHPITGDASPNWIVDKTGDFIESITNNGAGDVIKFARDFHGILNGKASGTTLGNWVLTPLDGASVNLSEDGYTPTNTFVNASATANTIASLVNAPKGSSIRVNLSSAAAIANSFISLTNCYL